MIDVLKFFPENYQGYCIEAGDCDGLFLSNTLELEALGWFCLCIEPNPIYHNQLIQNRKLWRFCALGDYNAHDIPFKIYWNEIAEYAGISSLEPDMRLIRHFSPHFVFQEEIQVQVCTLNSCLENAGFPRLDFLSLDVEGGELNVLKGLDFNRWKPQLMQIENHHDDPKLVQYLIDRRYKRIDRIDIDDFWIPEERM